MEEELIFKSVREKSLYYARIWDAEHGKDTISPKKGRTKGKRDPILNKISTYKLRCIKSNREYSLTDEQFLAYMKGDCAYCGEAGGTIDRIDSLIGYVESNCQSCCNTCNTLKMHLPHGTMINQVKKIYEHLFKNT